MFLDGDAWDSSSERHVVPGGCVEEALLSKGSQKSCNQIVVSREKMPSSGKLCFSGKITQSF